MSQPKKSEKIRETARLFFTVSLVFTAAALILQKPVKASEGVTDSVKLCLDTVIPSLFPFLFVADFTVTSGIYTKLGKPFEKLTRLLYRLPGEAACILVMGLFGGFPVGTAMACRAAKEEKLSLSEAKRLCLFAVNAGPAFVIHTVGVGMTGSRTAGVLLYTSLTISALLMGIPARFLEREKEDKKEEKRVIRTLPLSLTKALSRSAQTSPRTMLNICVWITVFRCLMHLTGLDAIPLPDGALWIALMEVTSGCKAAAGAYPLPVLAAILGWGGLSIHCQLLFFNQDIGLDGRLFVLSRAIHSLLSFCLCKLLLFLFPIEEAVFSGVGERVSAQFSGNIPAAAGMLFMCALLLLGENFSLQKGKERLN